MAALYSSALKRLGQALPVLDNLLAVIAFTTFQTIKTNKMSAY